MSEANYFIVWIHYNLLNPSLTDVHLQFFFAITDSTMVNNLDHILWCSSINISVEHISKNIVYIENFRFYQISPCPRCTWLYSNQQCQISLLSPLPLEALDANKKSRSTFTCSSSTLPLTPPFHCLLFSLPPLPFLSSLFSATPFFELCILTLSICYHFFKFFFS